MMATDRSGYEPTMEIRSDRRYHFELPRPTVWAAITDVTAYPRWWSWLGEFDGERLAPGEVWTCAVHPPLPYVLRFRLTIDEVEPERLVTARVSGDIGGTATLWMAAAGGASSSGDPNPSVTTPTTEVRLRSRLAPRNRWLAAVAATARPVVRYGHDWVLDTGASQFAARAATHATRR
jgi:uncharacterized protein YndB with AHSA1/START domain